MIPNSWRQTGRPSRIRHLIPQTKSTRYIIGIISLTLAASAGTFIWHHQPRPSTPPPPRPKANNMSVATPFQVSQSVSLSLTGHSNTLPPFHPPASPHSFFLLTIFVPPYTTPRSNRQAPPLLPNRRRALTLETDGVCRAHDLRRVRQGHFGGVAPAPGHHQGRGESPGPAGGH